MTQRPRGGERRNAFAGTGAIARVNIRRLLGDRRLLVVATILPVVLILVTGLLTGGTKVPIGVVNRGSGPVDARLMDLLAHADGVKVRVEPDSGALDDDVLRSRVVAGIEVPEDFGSTQPLTVTFVGESDQAQAVQAHTAVVAVLDILVAEEQAARAQAARAQAATKANPSVLEARTLDRAAQISTTALDRVKADARPPLSPFSYVGPADLVLFGGILVLVMASGLVESRRLGLLRRMLAAPVRPTALIAGQMAGLMVAAVGQSAGLLLIGSVLFGVRWGDPAGVALVVICFSLALASGSTLLGTLATSQEQAVAVAVILAIAGGMLGGCLWPLSVVGPLMAAAGHVTPQAWAMDALVAMVYDHTGIVGVLPDAAALLGFAVVLGILAAWRLRRTLGTAPG